MWNSRVDHRSEGTAVQDFGLLSLLLYIQLFLLASEPEGVAVLHTEVIERSGLSSRAAVSASSPRHHRRGFH